MRHLAVPSLVLVLSAAASAQTVGVTLVNDYWVTPGGLPNAMSCAPLTINTPTTMNMNVTGAPGTAYVVFWSFCGCTPCAPFPPMGISGCLPGPTSACPASNQFLEVVLFGGCVTFSFSSVVNAAGFSSISVNVPLVSPPLTLGSQAAFIGPPACVVAPFNVLVSPAWSVTFQ